VQRPPFRIQNLTQASNMTFTWKNVAKIVQRLSALSTSPTSTLRFNNLPGVRVNCLAEAVDEFCYVAFSPAHDSMFGKFQASRLTTHTPNSPNNLAHSMSDDQATTTLGHIGNGNHHGRNWSRDCQLRERATIPTSCHLHVHRGLRSEPTA